MRLFIKKEVSTVSQKMAPAKQQNKQGRRPSINCCVLPSNKKGTTKQHKNKKGSNRRPNSKCCDTSSSESDSSVYTSCSYSSSYSDSSCSCTDSDCSCFSDSSSYYTSDCAPCAAKNMRKTPAKKKIAPKTKKNTKATHKKKEPTRRTYSFSSDSSDCYDGACSRIPSKIVCNRGRKSKA